MLLRAAEPGDALAVARVHVRSWQAGYRELLPEGYLKQLCPEERAARYDFAGSGPLAPSTIVAAEGDSIRGFATVAPSRDAELALYGELCALYVDPDYWGRRIGAALVAAARGRLMERGFRNAFLWVLEGNARADRFYRIDGWQCDGKSRTDSVWGLMLNQVRYRRELSGQ